MRNKNAIAISLLTFGILAVCGVVIYLETDSTKIVATPSKTTETNIIFPENNNNEICRFSDDKLHKTCISFFNNEYYLIYDNNKIGPYYNLEFFSSGHDSLKAFKLGENYTLYINQFNNDFTTNKSWSNLLSNIKLILSPDLKTTVRVNSRDCSLGITYSLSLGRAKSQNQTVFCSMSEIIENGKSLGVYEWVEDISFKDGTNSKSYIVGEDCCDSSKCNKYFEISSGTKKPIAKPTNDIVQGLMNSDSWESKCKTSTTNTTKAKSSIPPKTTTTKSLNLIPTIKYTTYKNDKYKLEFMYNSDFVIEEANTDGPEVDLISLIVIVPQEFVDIIKENHGNSVIDTISEMPLIEIPGAVITVSKDEGGMSLEEYLKLAYPKKDWIYENITTKNGINFSKLTQKIESILAGEGVTYDSLSAEQKALLASIQKRAFYTIRGEYTFWVDLTGEESVKDGFVSSWKFY